MDYFLLFSQLIFTLIFSYIITTGLYKPYRYLTSKILDREYSTGFSQKLFKFYFAITFAVLYSTMLLVN